MNVKNTNTMIAAQEFTGLFANMTLGTVVINGWNCMQRRGVTGLAVVVVVVLLFVIVVVVVIVFVVRGRIAVRTGGGGRTGNGIHFRLLLFGTGALGRRVGGVGHRIF